MRWFDNLKVSKKLGLGFGIVLILLIALGIFSLGELSKMNHSAVDLASNWLPTLRALGQIQYDVVDLRRKELNLILEPNKEAVAERLGKLDGVDTRLAEHKKEYEKLITSEQERNLYQGFSRDLEKHQASEAQMVALVKARKHGEAIQLAQTQGRNSLETVVKELDEDVELNHKGADAATQVASAAYTSSRYWIVGALVAALALGLFLTIVITRSISKPVQQTVQVLESLAECDLRETLDIHTEDELGVMAKALNKTIATFRTMIATISQSAEQVASASEEISSGAGQTVESARHQADQTQQAATAMQEMTATVQQISESSQKAADTSRGAAEAARQGGQVVEATLSSMRNIATATTKTAALVADLGKSSEQIGKIIAVIDDIADQTNLLALNAAIEAARAGEQGRGFAVVADEVRKLAERTTKATKEIATMIQSIQSETRHAVEAMEVGNREVQVGVEKTSNSGSALKEIISMSERAGDMIAQIATAATEQSATTEQINANVTQISSAPQESSAAAEQTAKACTDLSSLAFDLQQVVSRFKLDSTLQVSPHPASTQTQTKARAASAAAGANN
jgi:methyl-accepting chemotaxis protein